VNKSQGKIVLVVLWVLFCYGALRILQHAYDKEKSFYLFVVLAITGNLAYDGLKVVVRYRPASRADIRAVVAYVLGFCAALIGAVSSLFVGAELVVFGMLGSTAVQIVSGALFVGCLIAGMMLLGSAERRFKLSHDTLAW